jgi:hypothetical protein
MGPFAPKGTDKHFDKADFIATLKAPMFWIFALGYFFMTNSLNAFGYFAPTLVQSMKFTGYKGQLLTIPPNVSHTGELVSGLMKPGLCILRHHWQLVAL